MFLGLSFLFLGSILLFFGVKWVLFLLFRNFFFEKRITDLPFTFDSVSNNVFSISLLDNQIDKVDNTKFIITSANNTLIPMEKNVLRFKFFKKHKKWVELYTFKVDRPSEISIQYDSIVSSENILLLVSASITNFKKILGIIFLVIGVNLFFWGLILLLNPDFLSVINN